MRKKIAYCTGFWCTNIGNAFFGLGVEYALKKICSDATVTLVSDYQTYTTSYGKRLYPEKNQLEYISQLDVDYVVLAGPVITKYFLALWKDILIKLEQRGVRYMILSAGIMKMTNDAFMECQRFFSEHPPYVLVSRDHKTYETFGKYAEHAYDGICFSFFAPDYYTPAVITQRILTFNFDKINEPDIWLTNDASKSDFCFNGEYFCLRHTSLFTKITKKTDRFSDAIIYATSFLPTRKRVNRIANYTVFRTDHRFHPHFRRKIYCQGNSFCADLPYGYLNVYANTELTLSDRVHACAVTLAYGHSAMLFSHTDREGLLERVGADEITQRPVRLDMAYLKKEKEAMLSWLADVLK